MKPITNLTFNWYATPENGEEFTSVTVGVKYVNKTCIEIEEHRPAGEGDKWYYDAKYDDGSTIRIFNPNTVSF